MQKTGSRSVQYFACNSETRYFGGSSTFDICYFLKGFQTRSLSCVNSKSGVWIDESLCDGESPRRERPCRNEVACLRHQLPQSSHMEHNEETDQGNSLFQWRKGDWSPVTKAIFVKSKLIIQEFFIKCSRTCGGGQKRRIVACRDSNGNSSLDCNAEKKPPEEISCNSEPCPVWNFGRWGQVRKNHKMKMKFRLKILF